MKGKTAYGEETDDSTKETPEDVARRLELNYSFDRSLLGGEGMSILAIVAANSDVLAEEFLRWWSAAPPPRASWWEALPEWERIKFGARLYRAPHGVLSFWVGQRIASKNVAQFTPKLTPGLTNHQRRDRMLAALDQVVASKTMPDAPGWKENANYSGPRPAIDENDRKREVPYEERLEAIFAKREPDEREAE
jgi:hypothetical protein